MTTLRLILGDQLHRSHSWCMEVDQNAVIVLMEVRSEATYVRHHIQKVASIFAAMRSFARDLQKQGHRVHYLTITDPDNRHTLTNNLSWLAEHYQADAIEYQEPDEWRVDRILHALKETVVLPVSMVSSEHFLTDRHDVQSLFKGKKTYLMETFYRGMRRRHDVLMSGDEPVGGRWNFDVENRKKWKGAPLPPEPLVYSNDLSEVVNDIESAGIDTIGSINAREVVWPIDREQALEQLEWFVTTALPHFGDYQDAMVDSRERHAWSMFHSRLSFALNVKILTPEEVIRRVERWWNEHQNPTSLPAVEGFIRQILGWREYMRGIYWAEMPSYAQRNELGHSRPLPLWYWTGETKMNCLQHAVTQSIEHAYAHHIQRLMVTGAFALMAGCDPVEVDAWYLGIYIDAFEWVEITNTRGMSQYADGGIVGSKPYLGSASYIHKMSTYCDGCEYDRRTRSESDSCPLNSLYWDFYERHRDRFADHPRVRMMYRVWDRMQNEDRIATRERAQWVLEHLEDL